MGASVRVYCPRYRWDKSYVGLDTNHYVDCGCRSPCGIGFIDAGGVVLGSASDSLSGAGC